MADIVICFRLFVCLFICLFSDLDELGLVIQS